MPIPSPHKKTESKQEFISRCMGNKVMNKDYTDQKQRAAICYDSWEKHKAKASFVIAAGDDEFVEFDILADDKVSDKPSYEEDPNTPKMPPGIKSVSPKDSQPKDGVPKETEDDGDSPDLYDEVDVQAARAFYPYGTKCPMCDEPTTFSERSFGPKVKNQCAAGHLYIAADAIAVRKPVREKAIRDRAKKASNPPIDEMPNPEKGGKSSAPNPDNDTAPIDSYDQGEKPQLSKMQWYMGSHNVETNEEGIAKWPLSFKRIEKNFKRPNKNGNKGQEPKAKDSQKPATEDKPYQTTTE